MAQAGVGRDRQAGQHVITGLPAAAAPPKPVWRSLPAMTPGAMAAAAYGNVVAPPVYRNLRVVRPAGTCTTAGGAHNAAAACGGLAAVSGASAATCAAAPQQMAYPAYRGAGGGMFMGAGAGRGHTAAGAASAVAGCGFAYTPAYGGGGGAPAGVPAAAAANANTVAAVRQQQPGLVAKAPPLPLIYQRNAKHFVAPAQVALADVSRALLAVAAEERATVRTDPARATMHIAVIAPPTAPDGGCSEVVYKIRFFALAEGGHLADFSHRRGSRVVASNLYRAIVARVRAEGLLGAAPAAAGPAHYGAGMAGMAGGGAGRGCSAPAARPAGAAGGAAYNQCAVYTVPRFQPQPGAAAPPPVEPAVAAATAAPLLGAAASPCFDQQVAACQLLAKLTVWGPGGDGGIALALLGALLHPSVRAAVLAVLLCLAPPRQAPYTPPVHETVRRCIVSICANVAHFEETTNAGGGNVFAGMLAEAGPAVLQAVAAALPGGGNEVHQSTFSSNAARDALVRTLQKIHGMAQRTA